MQVGIVWNPSKAEKEKLKAALQAAIESLLGSTTDVAPDGAHEITVTWPLSWPD